MRIALLSDIHANREALEACLGHAAEMGAERYIFLGDYVGYGADPEWVTDKIADYVAKGAIALLGNHDAAVFRPDAHMNDIATAAIEWTRTRLNAKQQAFLQSLPLQKQEDDVLFVHASADSPEAWHYVTDSAAARRTFEASKARLIFCGHVHVPCIYRITTTAKVIEFTPADSTPVELSPIWRWLNVIGAVGQPRDRLPAAAYAIFDTARNRVAHYRVPYDTAGAAAKIRAASLPDVLSARLLQGY
jgi:diadenosine tetraphosphatase ApaH/serine/threonine PP2A family protein phosphatase